MSKLFSWSEIQRQSQIKRLVIEGGVTRLFEDYEVYMKELIAENEALKKEIAELKAKGGKP